jgi:ParB family chromosome partitioning protein
MARSKREKPFGGRLTSAQPSWLVPEEADAAPPSESQVKLSDIHLPANQPRHYFDPQALKGLADSIAQHGLLQPLLVRPLASGGYELVAGERRYRAALEVGLTAVPVVVKELTDEAAWQLALIENLHREDLNPVEETEGILLLLAFKLGIAVSEVPPLLHRQQKERKDKALSAANNVIVKEPTESTEPANNVIVKEPTESTESANNVIGKEPTAETESANNVIVKSQLESTESANNVIVKEPTESTEPANNVIVKEPTEPTESTESANNVIGTAEGSSTETVNPELTIVEAVFRDLGLMTWQSFTNNRLPLLNLPEDITEALRQGQIAYTKAKAIAQVKDEKQRVALLREAVENDLSLSQIKEKISGIQPQPRAEKPEIAVRLKVAYQKVKKIRQWEDTKKRQQIEALLVKLEALID